MFDWTKYVIWKLLCVLISILFDFQKKGLGRSVNFPAPVR